MKAVSFRDLKNIGLSTLRKQLTNESVLVTTVNNKPFAAMINLDNDAQDTLLLVSRLRAHMAALSIRNQTLKR